MKNREKFSESNERIFEIFEFHFRVDIAVLKF